MWFPEGEPWQYRILDALPSGVDDAQLEAALKMTPTERVEAARKLGELAEQLQRARKASREG